MTQFGYTCNDLESHTFNWSIHQNQYLKEKHHFKNLKRPTRTIGKQEQILFTTDAEYNIRSMQQIFQDQRENNVRNEIKNLKDETQ